MDNILEKHIEQVETWYTENYSRIQQRIDYAIRLHKEVVSSTQAVEAAENAAFTK